MRDVKLNSIVDKVNKWLSFRNYKLTIETKENGYILKLFQGTHQFKFSAYQKDRFDSRYAQCIKDFTMDALTLDLYNCVLPIGDCWILTMIDEGLPLTDLMTKL